MLDVSDNVVTSCWANPSMQTALPIVFRFFLHLCGGGEGWMLR